TTEGGAGQYPKGATHLRVGSTANMAAGRAIWLDQLEETSNDGGVLSCLSTDNPSPNIGRRYTADGGLIRTHWQIVRIVSVDSPTQITITPGLHMPSWRASQKPEVSGWGRTDNSTAFGIGLEDLTVENAAGGGGGMNILVGDCYGCWIKNIRSLYGPMSH